MSNIVVPEFAVSDWLASKKFYCDVLGFHVAYQREEEGFAYLRFEGIELMIDQIGVGRTFGDEYLPNNRPFGKGVNVQMRVSSILPLLQSISAHNIRPYVPVEERWYRRGNQELGHRQFVVADPDGYLLRFFEDLGTRSLK